MATFTLPAQNRAVGSYGPFGPFSLGTDNEVDIQFNSTDWSTPGGSLAITIDRLPSGKADVPGNWVNGDLSETTQTGGTNRSGGPNIPNVGYDFNPGDQLRVSFVVSGRTINLGATITTSTKPAAAPH